MSRDLPVVAVVGRPNVGKSTLFNRILGGRIAIVDDTPGVTRDRNFARADWAGRTFYVVDTGGVVEGSDEPMDRAVRRQALAAIEEADVIALVVDGQAGVHPLDERLVDLLRDSARALLLVVNKMDRLPEETAHHDFWRLGIGEPLPVSAISGRGSGDLLDRLVSLLPSEEGTEADTDAIRVAVVGKPNVGKSSFVNRLLGEERVVVGEKPGTTRDPVDTELRYHGRSLVLVDTAGLRRQSRIGDQLEYYSTLRTDRVVESADVCVVIADFADGVHVQDLRIVERAWNAGCGIILALNKWDLVERDERTAPSAVKQLRQRMPILRWVPILFISALTGQRVRRALDEILRVQEERRRRIPTSEVNEVLERLVGRQPPPHSRGRRVTLKYATQVGVAPPTFVVFSNLADEVPEHYVRYLHNGFRDAWGFIGSPLRIFIRDGARRAKGVR